MGEAAQSLLSGEADAADATVAAGAGEAQKDAGAGAAADAGGDAAAAADGAGDKSADSGDAGGESKDQEPAGAPEKYDLKVPAGEELDASVLEAAEPVMRDLGLTNDQAQKLVDLQVALGEQAKARWEKFVTDQHAENWAEVQKDKTLGGDNFQDTQRKVGMVMRKFDTDGEMGKLLVSLGADNAPAIVRFANNVARSMSEDTLTGGESGGKPAEKPPHEVMYDGK